LVDILGWDGLLFHLRWCLRNVKHGDLAGTVDGEESSP